jgi:hypothetical protein
MINTDYVDTYLTSSIARQQVEELHAAGDRSRLARAYREAHPELGLRCRMAGLLRRTADRLAPPAGPQRGFPVISQPSPSPR